MGLGAKKPYAASIKRENGHNGSEVAVLGFRAPLWHTEPALGAADVLRDIASGPAGTQNP